MVWVTAFSVQQSMSRGSLGSLAIKAVEVAVVVVRVV